MAFNWSQRRNSILADEMGLGKTIQAAAFLHCLKTYQNVRGPFLVIAPLSTLINWYRELTAWTDLEVVLYHGGQAERELIRYRLV
jgi:SNF2 family DNA or RNA helicase